MNSNKQVVFQVFDDGSFSMRSSDMDVEQIGQMVFNIIYKLVRSPSVLTMESIHARRQAALEAYRQQYEMNHRNIRQEEPMDCDDVGEDEIDG